ncbi:MAG: thermolysin metallopeptidase [Lysobacteraceae bacterium]|nr:MAG: thermolysin metallopeptidase [Xanthomonadaceae bacterium]
MNQRNPLCIALALLLSAPLAAKNATDVSPLALETRSASLVETTVQDGMRVDARTGRPFALYNVGWQSNGVTPVDKARSFMASHADLLRLTPDAIEAFVHVGTRDISGSISVRFRQMHLGLPVLGGEMVVNMNRAGVIGFVVNGHQATHGLTSSRSAISDGAALQAATTHLSTAGHVRLRRTELAILPSSTQASLVWNVRLIAEHPIGDWQVLVDAVNGELVQVRDLALYAPVNGSGKVFDPDPLAPGNDVYGGNFVDGSDATNTDLDNARFDKTLFDIDLTAGTHALSGPYAQIVDSESPNRGLFSQASSTFDFTRQQNGFEAVNCYYHIDTFMRYINVTLGIPLSPFQYAGGVRFDPHGLNGADNSHYTGGSGEIAFGEGGVDDAEDADVVIHELGHGIHDWLTGGNLSQVEGLSEGLGDYFAASYKRSLGHWTNTDAEFNWVFGWDGHNPFWSGRVTNYGASYPGGLVSQIHTDGQIISTALMRIWDIIGREQTDRAVLAGIAMTGSSTNQQDLAQAVLQAAHDMMYPGHEQISIADEFAATGYMLTPVPVELQSFGID